MLTHPRKIYNTFESETFAKTFETLSNFFKSQKKHILICSKNIHHLEGLAKLFNEMEFSDFKYANVISDVKGEKSIFLCQMDVQETSQFEAETFFCYSITSLLGKKLAGISAANLQAQKKKNLTKLQIQANTYQDGDLVVHKEHGVAIFSGLSLISHGTNKTEVVKLCYKNGDAIYIPIYNIDLISKYSNSNIPEDKKEELIDSLGSKSTWGARKRKTKEHLFKIASQLIEVAAKRKLLTAKQFLRDEKKYSTFDSSFEYTLTSCQENAILDIETDLASSTPMDRLICGDVGFGKTEVAMRAAFFVCQNAIENTIENTLESALKNTTESSLIKKEKSEGFKKSQVAVVVPTTILASQHFNNFVKRFDGSGLKIAQLSRNIHKTVADKVKLEIANGDIDIVIGTHALLANKIEFNNLSLVIIDEEQHFGVKQKEKLKQGRSGVHFLLLSATPIPRTLQMSLAGVRDISILVTPPFDRLMPKTFITNYDEIIITEAIEREILRNGRVFFVCPRISDLDEQKQRLSNLMPSFKFETVNGRMNPDDVDEIMTNFYEGKFHCLISTSIVESGIDISFANTIFIYKANMFGLSQMHQLRGRVGRGNVQAYCYLIVDDKEIKESAQKGSLSALRLKILTRATHLGDGFSIANSDLDIRGAGNLVGSEQSGKIEDVGVELYQEMLAKAITDLKQTGKDEELESEDFMPEIKTGQSFFIPDDYIEDQSLRMQFYRRIASCKTTEEVELINLEISDKFGKIPEEVLNLLKIVKLKLLSKTLGIIKADSGPKGVVLKISNFNKKTIDKVFALVENKKTQSQIQIISNNDILFREKFFTHNSSDIKKVEELLHILT